MFLERDRDGALLPCFSFTCDMKNIEIDVMIVHLHALNSLAISNYIALKYKQLLHIIISKTRIKS